MVQPADSAIRDAVVDRAVDRVFNVIRFGPDLTQDGPALLKLAVAGEMDEAGQSGEEPHVDLTTLLLIGGADPRQSVDGESAVELAGARGHWLAALVMDRWGRPPATEPSPPPAAPSTAFLVTVLRAIEFERFRELHDILAAGADVHTEASRGSLLMQALFFEADAEAQVSEIHLDCSALLLAMGADPYRPRRATTGPNAAELAADAVRYTPDLMLYKSWTRRWGALG